MRLSTGKVSSLLRQQKLPWLFFSIVIWDFIISFSYFQLELKIPTLYIKERWPCYRWGNRNSESIRVKWLAANHTSSKRQGQGPDLSLVSPDMVISQSILLPTAAEGAAEVGAGSTGFSQCSLAGWEVGSFGSCHWQTVALLILIERRELNGGGVILWRNSIDLYLNLADKEE